MSNKFIEIGALISLVIVMLPHPALSSPASTPDSLVKAFYATEKQLGFHFLDKNKDYNHTSDFGWGATYYLQAELMAYRTTHDTTLLTHFVHVADAMLTDRDDFVGQRDYRGAVAPGWSTERQWNPKLGQNVNGVAPMRDLAQDANIVCPYLQFCEIVFADTAQLRIYKAKAEYYQGVTSCSGLLSRQRLGLQLAEVCLSEGISCMVRWSECSQQLRGTNGVGLVDAL